MVIKGFLCTEFYQYALSKFYLSFLDGYINKDGLYIMEKENQFFV